LRTGFRPSGTYKVSFVVMHAGNAFSKKGASELSLPKMDIPIGLVNWEVFLPAKYRVADFGGDALHARVYPASTRDEEERFVPRQFMQPQAMALSFAEPLNPGEFGGIITDPAGSAISQVAVTITHLQTLAVTRGVSDSMGRWLVTGVPA